YTVRTAERPCQSRLPAARRGATISSLPVTPPSGPLGWSNGVDTRILRTPTSLWPWRAIAQFRYGNTDESRCTGTLIGPRHLVTAAHCINEKGTNNWYTIRGAPDNNGL